MKKWIPLLLDMAWHFFCTAAIVLFVMSLIMGFCYRQQQKEQEIAPVLQDTPIPTQTAEPVLLSCVVSEEPTVEEQPTVKTAMLRYQVPLDDDLQLFIARTCEDYHIEPTIILAMIERESTYVASAVGDGGNSLGLMQIQPRYHAERMQKLGCTDLLDPYQNVLVGIDLLADLADGNSMEWALMAYNGGASYANEMTASCTVSSYVTDVLKKSDELKGSAEMIYTDDPIADFGRHEAEQAKRLAMRPVCCLCDEHIQDEEAYYIYGEWVCEDCIESHRQAVVTE